MGSCGATVECAERGSACCLGLGGWGGHRRDRQCRLRGQSGRGVSL